MAIAEAGVALLEGVGLGREDVQTWSTSEPTYEPPAGWSEDAARLSQYAQTGQALLGKLPSRPSRSEREQSAAEALHAQLRAARVGFLRRHAGALYAALTDG